jgi:hypothetical protein
VDFFKNGVPASVIAALVSFSRVCSDYASDLISHLLPQVVVTVGFLLMKAIGSVFPFSRQQIFQKLIAPIN